MNDYITITSKHKPHPHKISRKQIDLIKVSSYGLAGYSHDLHSHELAFAVSHGRALANPIGG